MIGSVFNIPLNVHESKYNRIEFWYKIVSDSVQGNEYNSKVNIADKYMYPHNYFFFLSPMSTSKVGDFFDGETQSYADFTLSAKDNDGKDIVHNRQFLFGKNLLLWTRDIFEMKDTGQYFAGPQWRTEEVERININTYLIKSDGSSLVYFVPREGVSSNILKNQYLTAHNNTMPNIQVVYQKKKGQGGNGKKDYFESIIIPLLPSDNPQKVAKSISVEYDKDGTTLLKVGETLLLLNPSGTRISAAGLITDAKTLTLTVKDRKVTALSATETTIVEYKKNSLCKATSRMDVPKLGKVMNHNKLLNPFESKSITD